MRMWTAEPDKMCLQHLLGEHVELHMIRTALENDNAIYKRCSKCLSLIDTDSIAIPTEVKK